jgi:hypothetical protein
MNQTPPDTGRFDIARIAATMPETADTVIVDHYITNREAGSARVIGYRLAKIPMMTVLRTRTLSETRGFMKALTDTENHEEAHHHRNPHRDSTGLPRKR